MTNTADVVIWSADVNEETLKSALYDGSPLQYIKLDRLALTVMDVSKIEEVQSWGYAVFADAKLGEIPDKLVGLTKHHLQYKPWMLNCFAHCASTGKMTAEDRKKVDGLKRFADLCHEAGTKPCGVTVMTSKSKDLVAREFNGRTPVEQVLEYIELMLEAGFSDVVCSPEEVEAIRSETRFDDLELNTPAVRLPGTDVRDQSRVDTPFNTIAAGATRLVIGSNLTDGDLATNFARIDANLNPKD